MVNINISLFLVLFSIGALGSAYTSQYIFGLEPCILCLYQRIPFFITLTLSLISLFLKGKIRLFAITLCGISLISGAAIAFFHTGIENKIFTLEDGCVIGATPPSTIEEMTMQLMGKPNVPCNEPQFVFLGISMAGWNFLFSSAFGFITLLIAFRSYKTLRYIGKSDDYQNKK